jgi:hypothetical protein
LIQATVAKESGVGNGKGARDLRRTLGELWKGIMLESRVGRRRGAVTVRVVVDGDEEIAALFAANEKAAQVPVAMLPATGLRGFGDEAASLGPVCVPD